MVLECFYFLNLFLLYQSMFINGVVTVSGEQFKDSALYVYIYSAIYVYPFSPPNSPPIQAEDSTEQSGPEPKSEKREG